MFNNYYKPHVLSQVEKIYAFEMTSTLKFTRYVQDDEAALTL